MKKFQKIIIVFLVLVLIFLSFSVFYRKKEIERIQMYTNSLPQETISSELANNIDLQNYSTLLYDSKFGNTEWGISAPTKKMGKNNYIWLAANDEKVLYDFNYDSWNKCFECNVLVHKDFVFPNLDKDEISKIVLTETKHNYEWSYSPLDTYEDEPSYNPRTNDFVLQLSEKTFNELRNLIFGEYEKEYKIHISDDGKYWKSANFNVSLLSDNFREYKNIETVSSWSMNWYFEGNDSIYYNNYLLGYDEDETFYVISYGTDYMVELPKTISEEISKQLFMQSGDG